MVLQVLHGGIVGVVNIIALDHFIVRWLVVEPREQLVIPAPVCSPLAKHLLIDIFFYNLNLLGRHTCFAQCLQCFHKCLAPSAGGLCPRLLYIVCDECDLLVLLDGFVVVLHASCWFANHSINSIGGDCACSYRAVCCAWKLYLVGEHPLHLVQPVLLNAINVAGVAQPVFFPVSACVHL